MKIAVCFSGQIRTGVQASPNIINYIGNLWDNCTFFCHSWTMNTRKPYNANGIYRDGYPLDHDTLTKFVDIYGLYGKIEVEQLNEISSKKWASSWQPMHYSWRRSIEVMQEYQIRTTNFDFDFVVKLRPDILLRPTRSMSKEIANCLLKHDKNSFFSESTFSGNYGIIDDVMYIHGIGSKAHIRARKNFMSTVQGHLHTQCYTEHYVGKKFRVYGTQVGCGINHKSYAMAYAKYGKRPAVGCAVVLNNGQTPINLLMPL